MKKLLREFAARIVESEQLAQKARDALLAEYEERVQQEADCQTERELANRAYLANQDQGK